MQASSWKYVIGRLLVSKNNKRIIKQIGTQEKEYTLGGIQISYRTLRDLLQDNRKAQIISEKLWGYWCSRLVIHDMSLSPMIRDDDTFCWYRRFKLEVIFKHKAILALLEESLLHLS